MSSSVQIYSDSSQGAQLSVGTSIYVAQNEPMVSHVFNRNIKKLLQNDLQLFELYKAVFNQLNIVDYSASTSYSENDLVWFRDASNDLFLLKCLVQNNSTMPDTTSDEALRLSGWDNQNKYLTIFNYGISEMLSSMAEAVVDKHQQNEEMHPLGKVSVDPDSDVYIGKALLNADLSNLDEDRKTTFFPQQMMKLDAGSVVVDGCCRQYGKIMEYDIVFKLASSNVVSPQQMFDTRTTLSANTLVLKLYNGYSSKNTGYQDNGKYFLNTESMSIFSSDDADVPSYQSSKGLMVQLNRNDYVNTYSATITFPTPFADLNYMVFGSSVLSQTNGTLHDGKPTMVPSANDIIFTDKTRQSITALDITFPDSTQYLNVGHNAQTNGLVANSFHCKIIGKTGA